VFVPERSTLRQVPEAIGSGTEASGSGRNSEFVFKGGVMVACPLMFAPPTPVLELVVILAEIDMLKLPAEAPFE